MKKYFVIFIVFCILTAAKEPASRVPTGLMVEYIREPGSTPIMDLSPEFSWIVPAEAGKQSAYQILVSTSRDLLLKGEADVWDGGKTAGSNSSSVEFGNGKLKHDTRYFWKVRIWDIKKRPTGYSVIGSFTTGDPRGDQATQNSFRYSFDKPVSSKQISARERIFDFGKDAFGTLILNLDPDGTDTILIRLGEKVTPDGRIDRDPGGSIRYQQVRLPLKTGRTNYTIAVPADARNTGPAAIHLPDSAGVVTPFRYVEIEKMNGEFLHAEATRRTLTYYFDDNASSFISSDTILNAIWNICRYSMKATSFAGVYIDGDRERIPYEADAYINQLGHYYTDREYSMSKVTDEYFIHHPTWPTEWILQTVPLFYNDFMFTGDAEPLKKYYSELRAKTLVAIDSGDGLISSKNVSDDIMKSIGFTNPKERIRDIVDWPPARKDTGWKLAGPDGERDGYDMREVNTMVNAFYYNGLVLMSKIAGYLGNKTDSVFFKSRAMATYKAFNEKLFDSSKGAYIDGEGSVHSSLHANMSALAFGLVPPERAGNVVTFIKSRGMACSVYGAQYLLEALYNAGEEDYALSLLTSTGDRSWYNMIRTGSTITMEAWDMKYKPNSDWNHAWGAAPANIIPGNMWGISPAEPGFAKAIIRPQFGNLKYSKIKVPTIRGTIEAEYNSTGKTIQYLVTLPGNMECDLVLPGNKIFKLNPGKNIIIRKPDNLQADIIIYGSTPAAVAAASEASRMGCSVIMVTPDRHLGGMSSSGLGYTDTGNKEAIGGIAREFYREVYKHYLDSASWKWQRRSDFGNKGQGTPAVDKDQRTMWIFEPHVAENIFERMITGRNIRVFRNEWLDREKGTEIKDKRIISITTLSGRKYSGKVFIDATYEGDLMAAAGVSYTVGREANPVYNETWNGVQPLVFQHAHYFKNNIDPYNIPGKPGSGLLPLISSSGPGNKGDGDNRIQAYCYRTCLTKIEANRIPFFRPDGYDSTLYELLIRVFNSGWRETFNKFDAIPNAKTDVNNHGPFSFDNIGMNYDYPGASYERRNEILKEHTVYQQGLLWFISHDKKVPSDVREEMNRWGYSKDEFADNNFWPYQIYVREARRMKGKFVMTENEVMGNKPVPDPVGMGSYTLDSHNVQRYVTPEGFVQNEGDIGVSPKKPYQVSLGSILPAKEECRNLIVPVCVSSSHIAFGSIRMEPVYMILGQSSGAVASMAVRNKQDVRDVSYKKLKKRLEEEGQILRLN